jgi:two-component system, chemotaxis family, response regulator Rcp1
MTTLRLAFHILVVDDNAFEARLLENALQELRQGSTVHTVFSPEEAIRFLYKDAEFARAPRPHLVFLDYRMPSNGGRVLSILKGDPSLRIIPVVALSTEASREDIGQIYDRHANCCINKPASASDLNDSVRDAIKFWMDVALIAP